VLAASLATLVVFAVSGCTPGQPVPSPRAATGTERGAAMKLTTTAFTPEELLGGQAGGAANIPSKYAMVAGGGRNVSLPFEWADVPPGAKSLVLFVVDNAPVAHHWMHWVVVDISPMSTGTPEGASGRSELLPTGARELRNSYGLRGYGGPQPPAGTGMHPYEANLVALDVATIALPEAPTYAQLEQALSGHVLATATCTGRFGR
jgi:Raf kinase inhibitor-like YbhB/YbcL family protein